MKFILTVLLLGSFTFSFSQGMQITVSAGKESVTVTLDNDNENKILNIKPLVPAAKEAFLTATIANEEMDDGWKRNFIIYDAEDNEMSRLIDMKQNTYCVSLKNLLPLLKKDKEYFLYTSVLPTDPQKAMEVKVARQLVCKIKNLSN
jgi:hypothetical protein